MKVAKTTYAPTRRKSEWKPTEDFDWEHARHRVKRLQMRIAKAAKLGCFRKVKSLQWILAHSYYAKLLAVKRVTSNKGKNTPGIDGVLWKTSRQKTKAAQLLRRHGYKALPLKRVYIPKKNGKLRPLGIPTMLDRAMQALHTLTLAPIAETLGDKNSYGFRQGRSCADALQRCFAGLCQKNSPQWVLEADIAACFDNINHQWLMDNIIIDKKMLAQWLKAGFMDKGVIYPTLQGTPQGGIISPLLMNMTLDGLEQAARKAVTWYVPGTKARNGVAVIRYADDFIVTSKSRDVLVERVLPAIKQFLNVRGLALSEEKTRIVNVSEGFEFLGQHLRRYDDSKLIIKPTMGSLKKIQENIVTILKGHNEGTVPDMIRRLNQTIRGYCNYHRTACSSKTFYRLDNFVYRVVKHWLHCRHPNKGRRWIVKKYYRTPKGRRWTFYGLRTGNDGKKVVVDLQKAGGISIIRHVKVRSKANPFDPDYQDYFACRKRNKRYYSLDKRFVEEFG